MTEVNSVELLATTMELYDEKLNKSFEQERFIFNEFKKMPAQKTNQKGRVFPIYVNANVSINWRNEGGALPPGDTHKAKQMRVFYVRPAIGRRMSGDALDLSNVESIIDVLSDGMDMDNETLMKDINQEIFGDGTGVKAVIAGVGSNPTITFAEPRGVDLLNEGGQYQTFDPATGLARSASVSTLSYGGLDKPGLAATFNATVPGTPQVGDHIAWAGSYLNSLTGLEQLVSDGTGDFQGVSRADVHSLRSPNLDAASSRLSLSKIDQQEIIVGIRAGRLKLNNRHIYVTNNIQIQAYRDLGRNYQEYASGSSFDGGNGGIDAQTANGRKIWTDVDCKSTDWWMLNLEAFVMCELTPFGIINKDGMKLRMIPGFTSGGVGTFLDAYAYYIGWKGDIGLLLPQTCSRMYSLDTTGLSSTHIN